MSWAVNSSRRYHGENHIFEVNQILGKDNKIMIYLLRDELKTQLVTLHISETQYVMFGYDE